MDDNFPRKTPDAEPAQAGGGGASTKRELAVAGGEIYLTASETVRPGDGKFEAVVAEVLPDVAPSLSDNALGHSRGYSIAAVALILLFLCGVFTAWHLLKPRPIVLTGTAIGVPEPEPRTYNGRFGAEYRKAFEQIKSDQFSAARETLKPLVDKLLDEGDPKPEDANIFYDYFRLFNRLDWDDGARRQLAKLIEIAPDEYRWQLFAILNHPALARCDGKFRIPNDWELDFSRKGIADRIETIRALRRRHTDAELARQLDLCECYLALNMWRLENHKKRSDEIGVKARERAWEIAKKYDDNLDFIRVRIYIIEKMFDDGIRGHYTFDGRRRFRERYLKDLLAELKNKLPEGTGK